MKKLLLLFAILTMGLGFAQEKPEIGVGMSKERVKSAMAKLKSNIGTYNAWKYDWDLDVYSDAILLSFMDGDMEFDIRFNERNEAENIKVWFYMPLPKGYTATELIRAIGGAADSETVSEYGRPSYSNFNSATWNRTIDTVTGRPMKLEMILEGVGNKLKIYSKQTLIR